jgi:hypothetical protein
MENEINNLSSPKRKKEKLPMTKTTKRWVKVGIAAGIAAAIIIPASFATSSYAPTPKNTEAAVELIPADTPNEKEDVATGTAKAVAGLIAADLSSQLTEEEIATIVDGVSTAQTDPAGTAAKVYFVTFSNIPATVDYQASIDSVIAYLKDQNKDKTLDWKYVEATPEELENSNILAALKTWDAKETPVNPAIIEISYSKIPSTDTTAETLEIAIAATVY